MDSGLEGVDSGPEGVDSGPKATPSYLEWELVHDAVIIVGSQQTTFKHRHVDSQSVVRVRASAGWWSRGHQETLVKSTTAGSRNM
jgi:hypothetical protein